MKDALPRSVRREPGATRERSARSSSGAVLAIWLLAGSALSTFVACDQPRLDAVDRSVERAESSQTIRRFVAFREPKMTIASLETPTRPPVAVGTTLAGDLISSSDPSVLSIDASGNLVGHQNGSALVRTHAGATLQVTVNAVTSLQIVPDQVDLVSGTNTRVRVIGDGRDLPTASYQWETTNPNMAVASGSTVYAGYTPGTATLTVRSGNSASTLRVAVRAAGTPSSR